MTAGCFTHEGCPTTTLAHDRPRHARQPLRSHLRTGRVLSGVRSLGPAASTRLPSICSYCAFRAVRYGLVPAVRNRQSAAAGVSVSARNSHRNERRPRRMIDQWAMIEGAINPGNPDEWAPSVMLLWVYVVTGPPAACFFSPKVAEKSGIWPGATTGNVTLEHAVTLLILVAGPPISVLAFAAAILMKRRWREALPLWFLAAGFAWRWPPYGTCNSKGTHICRVSFLALLRHASRASSGYPAWFLPRRDTPPDTACRCRLAEVAAGSHRPIDSM